MKASSSLSAASFSESDFASAAAAAGSRVRRGEPKLAILLLKFLEKLSDLSGGGFFSMNKKQ
ncbi:hypothetical protein IC582_017287 [Cucumis melo]